MNKETIRSLERKLIIHRVVTLILFFILTISGFFLYLTDKRLIDSIEVINQNQENFAEVSSQLSQNQDFIYTSVQSLFMQYCQEESIKITCGEDGANIEIGYNATYSIQQEEPKEDKTNLISFTGVK